MEFVLNRDKTVSSVLGHTIEFKKGIAVHVPHEMWTAVQGIGAIPAEDLPADKLPDSNEPTDPAAREQAIFAGFEKLVNENKRGNFTGVGLPHGKALKEVLGFSIHDKARDALWTTFKNKDTE